MAQGYLGALPALQINSGLLASDAPLTAFRQGQQDRREEEKRGLLRQVGEAVSGPGGYLAASKLAMQGGELQTGLALQKAQYDFDNMGLDRKLKLADFFVKGAEAADTPEKWGSLVKMAGGVFGDQAVSPYRDFSSRPSAMSEMERTLKQLQMKKLEAETTLAQANAKAAGTKDILNEAIAGMITGGGAAGSQPPASGVIPQSYQQPYLLNQPRVQPISDVTQPEGATAPSQAHRPQTPPGIVLVGDDADSMIHPETGEPVSEAAPATPGAPNPGAVYNLPADELVNTPFGRMTRDKARRLGMGLAASGRGDAGRMMMDAASGAGNFAKPTLNKIEEKQFAATEQLARLQRIRSSFKPEYLQIENRVGYAWNELVSKFKSGAAKLTPQQQTELGAQAAWKSDSFENLNQYIKEITGAQMSIQEAQRIMRAMPNPGEGIFDGDSPVTFKAKLDAAIDRIQLALARYSYLKKNGFAGTAEEAAKRIPLDKMKGVIQDRATGIFKEIKGLNPGLDDEALKPLLRQRLRAEFGMDV